MNFIEAVRAAKEGKQISIDHGVTVICYECFYLKRVLDGYIYQPSVGEMLSDDWEIVEKKAKITKSQFKKIWQKHFGSIWPDSFETACKELGL